MPRINEIPQPDDPRRVQRSEARRAEQARRQARSESAGASDRIELSENARLAEEVRNAPDVREDRVAEARARMEAGEFDSEEVRRAIADRLLEQFGL